MSSVVEKSVSTAGALHLLFFLGGGATDAGAGTFALFPDGGGGGAFLGGRGPGAFLGGCGAGGGGGALVGGPALLAVPRRPMAEGFVPGFVPGGCCRLSTT
jgi:hypothetical protein